MQSLPGWKNTSIVRFAASLWLGSVVLVLVLVALACATVYESMHGTERALAVFYTSRWFQALLALLVIGVMVALATRFPFSKAKIGFVLTHASIAVILVGALVTRFFAIDGQLALLEGESSKELRSASGERLTLTNRATGAVAGVDLNPAVFGRLDAAERPSQEKLTLDGVEIGVARYLPDSVATTSVANDSPQPRTAVEISLSQTSDEEHVWVFAGDTTRIRGVPVALTVVANHAELERRLTEAPTAASMPKSIGALKIKSADGEFELPVESCMNGPVPIGQTDYQVRMLDYFPHATVGEGGAITSASSQPVNPAIRVEITGPKGTQTQIAFARFPDFSSTHGGGGADDVKVTFIASGAPSAPSVPVEVLATPDGEMSVRFTPAGGSETSHSLRIGEPVDMPWPGKKLTVLRRFDNARVAETLEIPKELNKSRTPAVLLTVNRSGASDEVWVRKTQPRTLTLGGTRYELIYGDQTLPLGFGVTLNKFTLGYYPGGRRPRSFESQITITDAASGQSVNRLISMNHPTSYGGFTFYQSSYQMTGDRTMSVLSVSRDPGTAVVFAGYIGLLAGMLWVLVARMRQRGHVGENHQQDAADRRNGARVINLLTPGDRCVQTPVLIATPSRTDGSRPRVQRRQGNAVGPEVRR
ncbi:MAG: cytochrome c biogenesis protein ResB [Phycisphaerales bacterium]|nr:cytochrome c biogenesis protein ResB [Phycisphaerales bacterium]